MSAQDRDTPAVQKAQCGSRKQKKLLPSIGWKIGRDQELGGEVRVTSLGLCLPALSSLWWYVPPGQDLPEGQSALKEG